MKNNKKRSPMMKIVSAAAMLAVSASMLGTSTYAWFTMNTTVQLTGMTVNAQADLSLVVKGDSNYGSTDTDYTALGTNVVSATTLKPCTSKDGVTFGKLGDNVKVKSAASSNATWSGTDGAFQASDLSTIDLANQDGDASTTGMGDFKYVAMSQYSVKSIQGNQTVYVEDVDVSVSGESATNPMLNSVRVAVYRASTSTTLIFNPNNGSLNDGKVGSYTNSAWALTAASYNTEDTQAASLGSFTANTADDVMVYIWFEGQDTTCFTDNIDTDNLVVTLKLTTTEPNS
jgi:hypothetical protein